MGNVDSLASCISSQLRKHDPLQPWLTESHLDENYWDIEAIEIAERLTPNMSQAAIRIVICEMLGPLLGQDLSYESIRLDAISRSVSEYLR